MADPDHTDPTTEELRAFNAHVIADEWGLVALLLVALLLVALLLVALLLVALLPVGDGLSMITRRPA